MIESDCCGAEIYEDTDICSDCKEHCSEQEEEACCQSSENGFKCTCVKGSYIYSQQAEDDGQADYDRDQAQDRAWEETEAMNSHNETERDHD
jgi:hypothetical protein